MKYIHPPEIAAKIMTMMDTTKDKLVIISPYNKVKGWIKLEKHIKKLCEKNIEIEWYIRKRHSNEDIAQIREFGIDPIEIENLHTKIYFNENYAIVTSMNLHQYSDSSSIDFAYMTETQEEYEEIIGLYQTYIKQSDTNKNTMIAAMDQPVLDIIYQWLLCKDTENIYHKRYRDEIRCENIFARGLKIEFVNKISYFRIIYGFMPPGEDWKARKIIYNHFADDKVKFEKLLGHEIGWGKEMKRIKIDLKVTSDYNGIASTDDVKKIIHYIEKSKQIFVPEYLNCVRENKFVFGDDKLVFNQFSI